LYEIKDTINNTNSGLILIYSSVTLKALEDLLAFEDKVNTFL